MNEFDIIRRYFTRPNDDPDVLVGVGDDAAVLAVDGRIVVTVDTLVEGVHYPAHAPADAIGHRALAVATSDIAAMGARPRWCTLAMTMADADPAWLERFASGFHALAERLGVVLIGGNIAHAPPSFTVEVIGVLDDGRAPLLRGGGRPGDDVYVTGTLGDAAGGLELLGRIARKPEAPGEAVSGLDAAADGSTGGAVDHSEAVAEPTGAKDPAARRTLIERFLRPMPRIDAGLALTGLASASIDISDGLAADLGHLCRASGCGAEVNIEALPRSAALAEVFSPEMTAGFALTGGDDYELCFTAQPASVNRIAEAMAHCRLPATRIGRLTRSTEIVFRRGGARIDLPAAGYLHF